MAEAKQRAKKKWFQIVGKGELDKKVLGESLAVTPHTLIGKHLSLNLMALTGDPKRQSVTLDFEVVAVDGTSGVAEMVAYRISSSHIKRVVRKAITKVEDSFVVKSKDNTSFRVKPLLISRFRMTKKVSHAIRKKTRELLQHSFASASSENIFSYVISNRLQMDLKKDLKKIFPLAISEIRVLEKL